MRRTAFCVGKKRVARLMRQLGIEGVLRRGKRRRTTFPDPAAPPAPDLVGPSSATSSGWTSASPFTGAIEIRETVATAEA